MAELKDVDVGAAGTAKIALRWGDGVHDFRLGIAEWQMIDSKCDVGPQELYKRFTLGIWKVAELRETMRCALIGGGLKPIEASKLVEQYIDGRPLMESINHAIAIIGVAILGPQDDPVGKMTAATDAQGQTSRTDGSPSLPSSAPELQ